MTLNPELLRRQMEITAPPKPKPTRGLELPPPGKTAKDMIPAPPKKGLEKGKLAWSAAAGILIGVNLAPKVQEYVDNPDSFNPQAIMRDITSFPGAAWNKVIDISKGFNWFKEEPVIVPDTFDPTAKKGVIGDNNSVRMTPEEYAQIAPPEIEGDNVNLPLFIKFPEGTNPTIRYELGKGMTGGKRFITRPNPDNSQETIRDSIIVNDTLNISGIPAGSILLSPVDGKIYHSKRPGMSLDGSYPHGVAFSIESEDEHGNSISITISTVKIKPLIETPQLEEFPDKIEKLAISIKTGDPIGIIMTEANHQSFPGQLRLLVTSIVKAGGIERGGVANISISTTPDGKAIVIG